MENLMRTNSKEYKERAHKAVLACIDFEHEGEDLELTDRQKIEYAFQRFESEYGSAYEKKVYPNTQTRLANWLMGIPFDFPFSNYDILEFAKELHQVKELTEKQQETILANYWNHIASLMIQIKEKLSK